MMLAICSNVWNVANTAIFDTFSGDFTKNVKNCRKNPRNLLLPSVLVNFRRRNVDVDIASTKQAFFVLWGREASRQASRF